MRQDVTGLGAAIARLAATAMLLVSVGIVTAPRPVAADQEPPSVTVTGSATAAGRPDIAEITTGVITQAPAAAAALARNNAAMEQVLKVASGLGIAARDVQTSGVVIAPQRAQPQPNRTGQPTIVGYEVSNRVRIRVRDLAQVGPLLDALVTQGANTLHGIELSIADPAPLLQQARARAIADARQKAEAYAGAAGVKLGRVLYIRDATVGPPRPMARAGTVAMAAVPIAPGEQELEVSVSVTYAIE